MNFSQNETQTMIAQTVRDFCDQHIRPHIMEWDEAQTFPVEAMKKLGELGLMGILVPEEYGGSGLGYDEYVTAITELGRVDPSVALSIRTSVAPDLSGASGLGHGVVFAGRQPQYRALGRTQTHHLVRHLHAHS